MNEQVADHRRWVEGSSPPHGDKATRAARRARPAHHFLLAFAAALIVPVLVLASWLAWQYAVSERNSVIERARSSARDLLPIASWLDPESP